MGNRKHKYISGKKKYEAVERAPLLETPKDMFSKALDWAYVSIGGPL